jgi:putative protein-disulfide isomerase
MKIRNLLIGLSLFTGLQSKAQEKLPKLPMDIKQPAIIYAYDALCGWCYGFSPVIKKLHEKEGKNLNFYVLSGGMVMGDRVGPISNIGAYIKQAYKEVEKGTGIVFGEGFLKGILEPGTAIFSSLKPGLALTTFKKFKPTEAMAFSKRLQKAVYSDGILVDEWESYKPLATEFGLDPEIFLKEMQSKEVLAATETEFAACSQLGVTGFPTVFYVKNNKLYKIAEGYLPLESLEKNFFMVKSK